MKKFASIILAAVLLATMLTVFAVPASADNVEYRDIVVDSDESFIIDEYVTIAPMGCFHFGPDSTIEIKDNGFIYGTDAFCQPNGFKKTIKISGNGGLCITFGSRFDVDAFIDILRDNDIRYNLIGNTVQAGTCRHLAAEDNACVWCGEPISGGTASVLSNGSLTIICSVACLAVGFLVAMFIFKKKKNEE